MKNINYTFIVHVIPDKKKEDLDREFYVVFELSYGRLNYNIVYDTKPKKLKIGWIWSGEPEKWKLTFTTKQFSNLKKSLKIAQFHNLNMNAIIQLNGTFFGHLFAFARDKGYIEGESYEKALEESAADALPEREPMQKRDPKVLNQEISSLNSKINDGGWQPDLGRQLGYCYFELGNLEKAEEEFFKYLTETKKDDVPSIIHTKWMLDKAESMDLIMSSPDSGDKTVASFSPEDMKKMYEEAKKNYFKEFEK